MLTIAAKESRSNLDATSDSRADANNHPAKETTTEEEKNSYATEKVGGHKTDIQVQTTLFAVIGREHRATRWSPPITSSTISKRRTCEYYEKVKRKQNLHSKIDV